MPLITWKKTLGLYVALVSTLLTGACHVCAPPVRVANNSAPAKFDTGDFAVETGVATVVYEENAKSPGIRAGLGYAINDKVAIEAGADTLVGVSTIGNVGVRIVPFPTSQKKQRVKLLFDVVLGAGLGVGGYQEYEDYEDECSQGYGDNWCSAGYDDVPWHDRLAGGAYLSTGIGFNVNKFDLFARFGAQVSTAENIPTTFIGTVLIAPQFNLGKLFHFYFGPGAFFYHNKVDGNGWFFIEGGLGFTFDLIGDTASSKKEKPSPQGSSYDAER